MALNYKYVIPPVGQVDNHIMREMFDDVQTYVNALGTGPFLPLAGGTISGNLVVSGTLDVTGATTLTSPATVTSSGATTSLKIDNTATDGDPTITWQLSGTSIFTMGVNDGSSDVLQLGTTAIDTATMWQATAAGEITQPLQPSFLVTDGTGATDVTGDGTAYTKLWPTEVFDQGGDFSSNTFTAPVTGRYHLSTMVLLQNILATHGTRNLNIVTSNRTFNFAATYSLAESFKGVHLSILCDMDANDTAIVTISVTASTKTVDIFGDVVNNSFCGSLIN